MASPFFRQAASLALCCLVLLVRTHAQSVALTFDDLPETGDVPPGTTRAQIGLRLAQELKQAGAPPVYGFINAGTLDDPDVRHVLERWREAGLLLGNHSYSHMNLNTARLPAYEHDVLRNEPVLRRLMQGQDWHWYRYPYLAEGNTLERRDTIRTFLHEHGYRIAEVTLDFDDYAYNEPYVRCLQKHDPRAVRRLQSLYLERAEDELHLAQTRSQMLFGREIAHVLLLHFNGFEAAMLPRLLALIQSKGYKLVTLEEAQADPAYALDPQVANTGASLLENLLEARHLTSPPDPAPDISTLDRMCR